LAGHGSPPWAGRVPLTHVGDAFPPPSGSGRTTDGGVLRSGQKVNPHGLGAGVVFSSWSTLNFEMTAQPSTCLCILLTSRIPTLKVPLKPPEQGKSKILGCFVCFCGDTAQFCATCCLFQFKPFKLQGCHPGRGGASATAAMARIIYSQHIDAPTGLHGSLVRGAKPQAMACLSVASAPVWKILDADYSHL
jgi:hypothetical protein